MVPNNISLVCDAVPEHPVLAALLRELDADAWTAQDYGERIWRTRVRETCEEYISSAFKNVTVARRAEARGESSGRLTAPADVDPVQTGNRWHPRKPAAPISATGQRQRELIRQGTSLRPSAAREARAPRCFSLGTAPGGHATSPRVSVRSRCPAFGDGHRNTTHLKNGPRQLAAIGRPGRSVIHAEKVTPSVPSERRDGSVRKR